MIPSIGSENLAVTPHPEKLIYASITFKYCSSLVCWLHLGRQALKKASISSFASRWRDLSKLCTSPSSYSSPFSYWVPQVLTLSFDGYVYIYDESLYYVVLLPWSCWSRTALFSGSDQFQFEYFLQFVCRLLEKKGIRVPNRMNLRRKRHV